VTLLCKIGHFLTSGDNVETGEMPDVLGVMCRRWFCRAGPKSAEPHRWPVHSTVWTLISGIAEPLLHLYVHFLVCCWYMWLTGSHWPSTINLL